MKAKLSLKTMKVTMRDSERVNKWLHFFSSPEEGHTFRSAQPLVTIRNEEVTTEIGEFLKVEGDLSYCVCTIYYCYKPSKRGEREKSEYQEKEQRTREMESNEEGTSERIGHIENGEGEEVKDDKERKREQREENKRRT
jgi:hypothetical protein